MEKIANETSEQLRRQISRQNQLLLKLNTVRGNTEVLTICKVTELNSRLKA